MAVVETIFCRSCKTDRPRSRFSGRVQRGDRVYEECLDCQAKKTASIRDVNRDQINARRRLVWGERHRGYQKNYNLMKKYGIGQAAWDVMFEAQGRRCKICGSAESHGRGWQTDHNHATGVVREILCHYCNTLIGYAKEQVPILEAAIKYLVSHGNATSLERGDRHVR